MRKINKLGKRAVALVLAVGLTLSTAAPVLAADADEVADPCSPDRAAGNRHGG